MLLAFGDFDNWRDEFDKEARDLKQTWEEMVEEVDDESLDVRAIVILLQQSKDRELTH